MIPMGVRGELTMAYCTLSAVHIKADGTRLDLGVISRKKVTQAFVKRIAAQMAASFAAGDPFKWHAAGVGTGAESNADTALGSDSGVTRVAGTQVDASTGTTGNYTSVATLAFTSGLAITEHGVFSAITVGTLLDRSLFSAVNVVSGDSIQFTYNLTMNPE
jgi:hypothetical protein